MLITRHFIFLHLPKTGGTFLRKLCRNHLPDGWVVPKEVLLEHGVAGKHAEDSKIPEEYRGLPRYGVVRNPWDWYVSWYHHEREREPSSELWEALTDNGRHAEFDNVVRQLCAPEPDRRYPAWTSGRLASATNTFQTERIRELDVDYLTFLHDLIYGRSLQQNCIRIGRFEEMRDSLRSFLIEERVPVPDSFLAGLAEAPNVRASKTRAHYRGYYDDGLRDLVGYKARRIIERYGYVY